MQSVNGTQKLHLTKRVNLTDNVLVVLLDSTEVKIKLHVLHVRALVKHAVQLLNAILAKIAIY